MAGVCIGEVLEEVEQVDARFAHAGEGEDAPSMAGVPPTHNSNNGVVSMGRCNTTKLMRQEGLAER